MTTFGRVIRGLNLGEEQKSWFSLEDQSEFLALLYSHVDIKHLVM